MKSIPLVVIAGLLWVRPEFAQTAPAQAAGYHLVFSDDFTNFDLSSNGYGSHAWYPGIYFLPTQSYAGPITVTPSGLNLQWDRSSAEYNTSMEGCAVDASHCNTYRYGYFEARMKWDVTTGAWPAFWMMTKQSILGVAHVGELDIFEGQGNDPTIYFGTVNEWNGATDLVSTNSPVNNRFQLAATNDYTQWHTYGMLWVPGTVTWYYDNQEVGMASTPAIFDQQDFFMVLGSQEGNNWSYGNLTGVTAQSINLGIQWVHVFQAVPPPATNNPARQTPLSSVVPSIVKSGEAVSQGPLPESENLTFTLTLPIENQAALDRLLSQLTDPQSPNFHQYLSADQFTASFGPTPQEYAAVVTWAQSKGLEATVTAPNRRSVKVSGSVASINQAFQITMTSYVDPTSKQLFFAPDQEPTLDLSVQLLAITGLTRMNRVKSPIVPLNPGGRVAPGFGEPGITGNFPRGRSFQR